MWVWVFPHHKWQKILSKSRGEAEWFGRNSLSRVVRKNPYSHFRSDSNHIVENYKKQSNTCWDNQNYFFKLFLFFAFCIIFSVKLEQSIWIFSNFFLFLYFLKFFSVKLKKAICKVLVLFYVHTLQIAKWWYCSMYTLYKLQSGGIVQYSHFVKCEHRPIPALCSPPCVYTEKCSTAKSLVIFYSGNCNYQALKRLPG